MFKTRVVDKRDYPCDIYIGRPSKWGNPFIIGRDGNREECIKKYSDWINDQLHPIADLHELRGKVLGCFCTPLKCHGDVLVSLVNALERDGRITEGETDDNS